MVMYRASWIGVQICWSCIHNLVTINLIAAMPHTEKYCLEKVFELLHVLINQHHIPLLFCFVDSNNIVQNFGTKNVKEKFASTWKNSQSWKQCFEEDRNELNSSNSDVLDGEPKDALRNHQKELTMQSHLQEQFL